MSEISSSTLSFIPASSPLALIVTGLSGAGKTQALKALEDLGFEVVDNLPLTLLAGLVRTGDATLQPLAVGIDVRTREFSPVSILNAINGLKAETGQIVRLLFLDCNDDVLLRRYTETRHRHPLAVDRPVIDGIRQERALLVPLRDAADVTLDTSCLTLAELKAGLAAHFDRTSASDPMIFVTSFSYRLGLPREADLVFDVRFLNNPHYVPELRPFLGKDEPVADFIRQDPDFPRFFSSLTNLLAPLLPRFSKEGKSYLTIAVGCTGGRHRSVFMAESLAAWLREQGQHVDVRHRDLEKSTI